MEEMLEKITRLISEGRTFEAWFIASLAASDKPASASLEKANVNPLEPRDTRSRWTTSGAGSNEPATVTDVQYRGHFHDLVADDLLQGLKKGGSTVLKDVRVLGLNGIIAIPDGVSKPEGFKSPYFVEVKIGNDPDFTENQKQVYPLICIGGHATTFDTRISEVGLTPGVPFPPMDILLVYTRGPGQPLRFESYCDEFVFGRPTHAP